MTFTFYACLCGIPGILYQVSRCIEGLVLGFPRTKFCHSKFRAHQPPGTSVSDSLSDGRNVRT